MNASLKTFFFSCCTVPLVVASGAPSPLVDHPPVDGAALRFHKQEMAFLENCFRDNPDNKVIWQADHEAALVWRTPRGANFNSYEFKAFLRQQDGSFREIGRYSVMSGYGYWDVLQQQWSANHWLLQYDLMFGKGYALSRMGMEGLEAAPTGK